MTATQGEHRVVTSTDENGRYEITGLDPGAYSLELSIFGFNPAQRKFESNRAQAPVEWTLELQPRAAFAPRRAPGAGNRTTVAAAAATQTQIDAQTDAALRQSTAAPAVSGDNANEAFLVNGSISRGLQPSPNDNQQGSSLDVRAPGGPGFGGENPAGVPGFNGGGGGRGAGGFGSGGRGGQAGPGGFGQRGGGVGGRRDPNGPGGPGAFIGNRANRGRDGIHGSAFFSLRNSALDARPFSFTGEDTARAAYAQSRFGVVLGGPLRIPKIIKSQSTFFFLNYTGTRARNPFQGVATVPTLLERSGDFSQSTVPLSQSTAQAPAQIFDPTTGAPFPNNLIPRSRINPAAGGLLSFIPLPNHAGSIQNYQILASVPNNSDNLGIRLNQNVSQKDRLALNLNTQRRSGNAEQLFGFRDETSGFGINADLSYTRNLSQAAISVLRFNFNRNRSDTLPYFAYKSDVAAALGIGGASTDPLNFGPPNLSFTNFGSLADAAALLSRIQSADVGETLSIVKGAHSLSAGGDFRRSELNTRTDQNGRGSFTFSGLETSAFNGQGQPLPGTGYDFADFLLGLPQSSSVRFGTASTYFRGNNYNFFGQDDWHARANLTIDAGLRYEYYSPLSEKYGHIANLDLTPGFTAAAVVVPGQPAPFSGSLPASLVKPDRNNWAPRIGVAWKPLEGKTLQLRSSYGVFYNGTIYNQLANKLASQPPFAETNSLTTSLADPLTLQNGLALSPSGKLITNTYAVDPSYRVGYAQTWSATVQQEFRGAIVVEAGYLGTKGTRLDILRLPNRALPGSPLSAEQRRQIGDAVGFTYESSDGDSIYHAAQLRVTRRFRRGMSFNAFYTFSKSIDNSSTFGGAGNTVAQNDLDLRAERGLSSFDQRHVLNLNWQLSSPSKNKYLQNWTLSSGLTAASGTPLTARVLGNQADTGGTGSVGSGRADSTSESVTSGGGFFNPAAFTIPAPGTFGNAGRNTIPGPSQFAINASVNRYFTLGDRKRLEFQVMSSNLTNHVSFTNLSTVVNASNYGLPVAAAAMRTVQASVRFRF